jgi:hypothetical protein
MADRERLIYVRIPKKMVSHVVRRVGVELGHHKVHFRGSGGVPSVNRSGLYVLVIPFEDTRIDYVRRLLRDTGASVVREE